MTNKIALSYSRISDYQQCPLKFKHKYVLKTYPDDSNNPAFVKGKEVHKQLEKYSIGLKRNVSKDLGPIAKNGKHVVDKLYKTCNEDISEELQIAVNHDWKLCSWFDPPSVVKFRVIIDLLATKDSTMVAVDWKTGKVNKYSDGPLTQLRLTAAILFNLYPKIDTVICMYVFLEHNEVDKFTFHRKDLDNIMAPFNDSYTSINNDSEFKFKKNKYCNWCLVTDCPVKL